MLCGVKCRVSLCVQLSENTCSSTAAAVNISRDGRDGVLQPDHRRDHHPGRTAGLRSLSEFLHPKSHPLSRLKAEASLDQMCWLLIFAKALFTYVVIW